MSASPQTVQDLCTPCFLVDIDVVKENCQSMLQRCKDMGVKLRPHMKTAKTIEAGHLMTGGSRRCIVVSTVNEAEFYAENGFDDILYAHIVTEDKLGRLKSLGESLEAFHVLVDSADQVRLLEGVPLSDNRKWSVWLKINTGYNRVGVSWSSDAFIDIASEIANCNLMALAGIYVHEGNAYSVKGDDVTSEGDKAADRLLAVQKRLQEQGIVCPSTAVGSTPSCSKPGKTMQQVTEMHPGNYVFYDAQQLLIGSCDLSQVSVRVLTRIMGVYPERNEIVVDCGFTALSHDGKDSHPNGSWCLVEGHPNLSLTRLSQEYGVIVSGDGSKLDFDKLAVGSLLYLVPYHSCATAVMHPIYHVHSKKTIQTTWQPCRGW